MTDDKWKIQPCKECILKGKCSSRCFDYPMEGEVLRYIKHIGLRNECLSCGTTWVNGSHMSLKGLMGCLGVCNVCTNMIHIRRR